jgi:Glycosyltransferase
LKKLIITCGTLECGGAERVLSILSHKFADSFDVTLVLWIDKPNFYKVDDRITIVNLLGRSHKSNYIGKICNFRRYIKNCNPDLVLSFLTPFNMLTLTALMCSKTKVVVAERSDVRRIKGGKMLLLMRNFLYRFAIGILVQTESNKNYLSSNLKRKSTVIYNPVIMPKEFVGSALDKAKKKMIVSVGRLIAVKNHKLLVDAFCQFRNTHKDYSLTIYGEGLDRLVLEQYIKSKNLESCVFLPGSRENVWDCILSSKVFVLSSNFEGMPNSLIEAMCLGLPCISTKVSGAIDLIKNGKNGFLVEIGNEKELVDSLNSLIDNEDLLFKVGVAATEIYNKLSYNAISAKWVAYLKQKIG